MKEQINPASWWISLKTHVYYSRHGISQIMGIAMGTNYAPFIVDLFLFVMRGILCLNFTYLNSKTF